MLSDPSADIVYVATPIGLHAEHGKQVLDARKHLWCEKPLTGQLQNTLELLESSRRQGLSICEGFMYLHHPQFRQLSKYITDGQLGSIKSIGCRFGIPRLEHAGFRSDPALGGGAFFDVGCYLISAIQALFPEENPNVGYANIITRDESAVDTDGQAVIALSNGAVANLEWGINCAYRNEIDIWGERGSVFTDKIFSKPADHIPVFRLRDTQGEETTEYGEANDHFVSMLQYFRDMINDLGATEAERSRIARRAEGLDRIWSVFRS
jgi:predicted dehydrogenase